MKKKIKIVTLFYRCFNLSAEMMYQTVHILPNLEVGYDNDSFWDDETDCKEIQIRFEWLIWTAIIKFHYDFKLAELYDKN